MTSALRTIGFATSDSYRELDTDDRIPAAALERMGFRVRPVVWTETAPHNLNCDLLVLRSCWDYHLHVEAFLQWISEISPVVPVFNPLPMLLWNSDKRYLFDLQAKGVPVPKTIVLDCGSHVDLATLMHSHGMA